MPAPDKNTDPEAWARWIGVGEPQNRGILRHAGTTNTVPVRREDNGKVGGAQHYHWDGSVSATVRPDTIRVKTGMRYYDQ